jgi:hypothetical protein
MEFLIYFFPSLTCTHWFYDQSVLGLKLNRTTTEQLHVISSSFGYPIKLAGPDQFNFQNRI